MPRFDDPDRRWVGVDFDGTLASEEAWKGPEHTGMPILPMITWVRHLLEKGVRVKIFTARVHPLYGEDVEKSRRAVEIWCEKHLGQRLEVVCEKDPFMDVLYDDRAIRVERNTGKIL